MKLVSVLFPVYKEPIEYLRMALNSIVEQTYKNLEIIIIIDDPQNTDVIEYFEKRALEDGRIKVYVNKENLGIVKTLNRAIDISTGDYIARMDADDISLVNRIEEQHEFLNSSGLDLIGSSYDTFIDSTANILNTVIVPQEKTISNHLEFENCLAHPTWFGKREVFINLKGYREIFACEDYDFLVRAINSGYKLGNCPDVLLHYRINSNSISNKNHLKQKVTFKYLSYNFRNKHDVSIEEYQKFLNSKNYTYLENAYTKVFKIKEGTIKEKIVNSIRLIANLKTLKVYVKYK